MRPTAIAEARPVRGRAGAQALRWLAARSGGGMVVLGLTGALTGALIVFAEPIAHWLGSVVGVKLGSVFDRDARVYVRRQETALWLFMLCAQVGLWAVLLVPIARSLESVRHWWHRPTVVGYVSVVAGSAVVVTVVTGELAQIPHGLPGHDAKVEVITALGASVAALAAAGVACVARGAQDIQQHVHGAASPADPEWATSVTIYLDLRNALDRFLTCTAAIIGAAILSTGALRNATVAWQHALGSPLTADAIFPQEQVLAYGIAFSAVLALIHLPVYQRLGDAAAGLRDARAPQIWPPADQWKERAEERSMLDRVLKIDQGATTSFRLAAGVLAPLASSLISRALG